VTLRRLALALLLLGACRRPSPTAPPRPARALPSAAQVSAGRALFVRFECARCHTREGVDRPPVAEDCVGCHRRVHAGTLPARAEHRDLWRRNLVDLVDAPSLDALGARVEPPWIVSFLLRPTDLRPALRATMPRLALSDAQARDLGAYLTADPDPALPALAAPTNAQIALGRSLFRQLDCARCHGFRDAAQVIPAPSPNDENRLAPDLSQTRRRFRQAQLAAWIRWPSRLKPSTPMPALTRSDDEAVALASYVWFAPLAPAPTVRAPAMLPVLARRVAWPEVAEAVFLRTCRHCHADASIAFGDGGPGNTGGFGFAARRLELATYAGALSGMMVREERQSAFAVDASGMPRLVHALRARQLEEVGVVEEGIRGMPLGHPPLTPEALQLVTSWIASGRPVE
jgi:mono/diheme cytochrome c family protein